MKVEEVKNFFDQLSAEEKAQFLQMVCQEMGCLPAGGQMAEMMSMMSCCFPQATTK